MPNARAHLIIGAITGAAVSITLQLERVDPKPDQRFAWGEMFICSAAAAGAALLPDLLEPATSPHHRGFCHSLTMAALVAYAISGNHIRISSAEQFLLLTAAGLGYLSHLAADATTPGGISIV